MTDWQTKRLGDVTTIKRGGSPRPIQDYLVKVNEEGYNWLRIGDVPIGSRYIHKTSAKIKPEGLKKTTLVKKGEFILSNSMSFGRPYIMMTDACIHDGWLALQNIDKTIDKQFLYYLLTSEQMQNKFKNYSAGSGVQNLKKETVQEIEFQAPAKPEQLRIANILETWDEYIEKFEQKIELKEQLKKKLVQRLLSGVQRLPRYTEVWRKTTIADLVEIKKGTGLSKKQISTDGRKCVLYGEIYTKYDVIIDKVLSRTNAQEGTLSLKNDILVPASTTTSNLDVATASCITEDGVLLGGDINILRPKTPLNGKYLAMLLSYNEKQNLAKRAQGITIVHLYGRDISPMKVTIPELNEQNAIVAVYESMREELHALELKLNQLKRQKDYLLKNLITGAIRTPENLKPHEVQS